MAVTSVKLFRSFNKRKNSTLKPSASQMENAILKCGELVEGCNILNPVISFAFNPEEFEAPEGFEIKNTVRIVRMNYAYIEDFERYYFIENWRHEFGLWVAEMRVDVLASWHRTMYYEDNNFYILRSSSEKNPQIIDTLYPLVAETEVVSKQTTIPADSFWGTNGNINTGMYVVGIINSDSNAYGSVSYYAFNPTQLRSLVNKIMGTFDWLNVQDVSEELTKALVNPFQYIVSCKWFPTTPSATSVSSVKYGWWSFPVNAWRLTQSSYVDLRMAYFTVEKHPDSEGDYSYLNTPPFRTITGFFEPWGVFEIEVPPDAKTIILSMSVDFITGAGILKIWRNASKVAGETVEDVLAYRQAQVGVPIQLSQMTTNILGVAENVANAAGGVVGGVLSGNFGGAIANAASGIISAGVEAVPKLSTSGTNGSFMAYNTTPKILTRFRKQTEKNNALFGSPLCKSRKLSEMEGFVQCAKPSVQLSGATSTERDEYNALLESGVYIEYVD